MSVTVLYRGVDLSQGVTVEPLTIEPEGIKLWPL